MVPTKGQDTLSRVPRRKTGKLIATVPGAANFRAIAERFLVEGGIVTTLSESLLRLASDWCGVDDPERETTAFRSVVTTLARLSNVEPGRIANARLEREAVAQACADLDVGSPFYRGRAHAGTHRLIAEAISELEHALYPWDAALPDSLPEGLAARMRSLAEIRGMADAHLSAVGLKRFATIARELVDEIPPEPLSQPVRLLVYATAPYNLLYGKLIEWMAALAEVWVVVERAAAGQDLFHDAAAYARHLPYVAEEFGDPLGLARHAFAAEPVVGPGVETEVWRYPDDLYEAEWTLRLAADAVEAGVPPHRICIFTRETEQSLPLLDAASRRLNVPVALERRMPLLSNALIRLVLRLLKSLSANDPRPLGAFARTSYLREPVQVQRSLSQAGREAFASGLGWQHEALPDLPWLTRLREWQRENGTAERSPIDWSSKLIELAAILQDQDETFREGPTEERDRRALERAQQEIRTWLSIRPASREPIALTTFLRICESLWSNAETFPPGSASGIRVASQGVAVGEADVLFALGVVEGRFPRGARENGVLGDDDRELLGQSFGVRLETSTQSSARERDEFYRIASASNRIVFSYPVFFSDDREQSPAFYLQQVPSAARTRQRSEVVPAEPPHRHAADAELSDALRSSVSRPSPVEFEDSERVRPLLPNPTTREVRELRAAAECGFQLFARYGLEMDPARESTRWNWLTRLPGRAGLAQAISREEAQERLESALREMIEELRFQTPEWEIRMLEAGGETLARLWAEREFVARQAWPRRFDRAPFDATAGPIASRCEALLIAERGSRPILRMTRLRKLDRKNIPPWTRLELGTRLLQAQRVLESGLPPVIELETTDDERQLICAFTPSGWTSPLGLSVVELEGHAPNETAAWSRLRRDLGQQLKGVQDKARTLQVAPEPGDHCDYCEYGELCRRSREYSEEVSPFDDGPEP